MARILLVEDDPWLGELYCQLLQHAGHTVDWCRDGYEAIDQIDQAKPAVIVLDLLLPWGNGLQLLHELASHVDLASIPVALCSNALPSVVDEQLLRHYGVVKTINKAATPPKKFVTVVSGLAHANS